MATNADPVEPALDDGLPLTELYRKRVRNNQDLFVLIDDHHNRRGTGKTVLSLRLAAAMDRTEEGLTSEKCSINAQDLIRGYTQHPRGSALVLDEAEVSANKFEAGTASNKAIRQLVSMGRVEQKYVVLNLPNSGELDKDLKALADVWIMVEDRGRSIVHLLQYQPYREQVMTPKVQELAWPDIPADHTLRDVYEALADEKQEHLDMGLEDDDEEETMSFDEARRQERDERIKRMYDEGIPQQKIADVFDLDQSRVSQILND